VAGSFGWAALARNADLLAERFELKRLLQTERRTQFWHAGDWSCCRALSASTATMIDGSPGTVIIDTRMAVVFSQAGDQSSHRSHGRHVSHFGRLLVRLPYESYDDRYWMAPCVLDHRDLSQFAGSNRSIRTRQRSNRPHFPAVLAETPAGTFAFSERGRSLRYGRLCCKGALNLAISKSCWSKTSRWLRDGRRRSVERRRRYRRGALCDSRQAIEFLHANDVDVAVIDFVLADANREGLQVALETKGIPFLVFTGYPRILVRRNDRQRVLCKPISPEILF